MTPEHKVMNEIRLWCGEHDIVCFRANVGKVRMVNKDGSLGWFDTGLPNGFSDLICLGHNGDCYFVECKKPKDSYQRKDQKSFQAMVESRGFRYILARSVDDVAKMLSAK